MKINITEEQYEKVIKKYLEEEMEDATGDNFERTHRDSPSDWERDYDNHDVTHDDIERIHRHVIASKVTVNSLLEQRQFETSIMIFVLSV